VPSIKYCAASISVYKIKSHIAAANGINKIKEKYGLAAQNKIEKFFRKIENGSLCIIQDQNGRVILIGKY
jgi:hypothetical protein